MPLTLEQTFGRALDGLFAACASAPVCRAAYPDLRVSYDAALHGLDTAPLAIPLAPGLQPPVMMMRGELFRLIVDLSLYSRLRMAGLPAFIVAARDRDVAALRPVVGSAVRTYAASSVGDAAAVNCRDRPSWHDAKPSDAAPVAAFVPGECAGWGPLGPPPLIAAGSAVPVLLLSGQIDPITPPPFARLAAAALGTRARLITFAHVGHGAQQATPCGEAIVAAFIRDPASAVDATCAAAIPPVSFRLPAPPR